MPAAAMHPPVAPTTSTPVGLERESVFISTRQKLPQAGLPGCYCAPYTLPRKGPNHHPADDSPATLSLPLTADQLKAGCVYTDKKGKHSALFGVMADSVPIYGPLGEGAGRGWGGACAASRHVQPSLPAGTLRLTHRTVPRSVPHAAGPALRIPCEPTC